MGSAPIAVIGGGMAGLAAAVCLTRAGRRVIVLERRAFLGGRATSFTDRVTGEEIDNCQHVVLGCCTNALDLLETIGSADLVEFRREFHYVEPGGARHRLRARRLPAPLHFLPDILTFGALSLAERLAIVARFLRMMSMSRASLLLHGGSPMAELLKGQSERALRRFWEPILVSAVNETLDVATALPCLQVFLQGFLPHVDAAAMGVPRVGLRALYADPAARFVAAGGGETRTRANVTRIRTENERAVAVELHDGSTLDVSGVVVALPPANVGQLDIDGEAPVSREETTPAAFASITGIHVWLEREAIDLPHAVLLDSPIHWVFARPVEGAHARGLGARQYLNFVASASHDLDRMSQADVIELACREATAAFPAMAGARVVHASVVKELRATISATPSIERARPGTATPYANVALAGDWTDTGWPATLEGAARSGRVAAAHLLGTDPELTPDLPRGLLARVLLARVPKIWPRL